MARNTKKPTVNLATAKVADGQSQASRSVYEMVGLPTTSYRQKSLADYTKMINGMNLIELQDHAWVVGELAGPNRDTLIDRLERRFIRENSRFAHGIETANDPSKGSSDDVRAEAARIISRGR